MFAEEEKSEKNSFSDAQQEQEGDKKTCDPCTCLNDSQSIKEQLMRLTADFQNYKKRVEKDQTLWIDRSKADLLFGILSIVDNFDRAFAEFEKNEQKESFGQWMEGFILIHKSLHEFLERHQVVPIEQMGTFDPHLHEAIAQVENSDFVSGDIVQVMQKGFMYKGTVLRTAKVSVAK